MSWEALTETASRHSRTFGYTETWPSQVEDARLIDTFPAGREHPSVPVFGKPPPGLVD